MLKTPRQIAEEYGFSVSHIRKLINKGRIKAEKVGKCYAIDPNEIDYIHRRRRPNTNKDDEHGSNK